MSDAAVDRVVLPIPVRAPSGALRKRVLIACIALIVAVGAAWYGHYWWTVARFVESTDDAYVGGEVTVIAPKVAGLIAQVAVTDNQAVHAGDLLVKLDDRDYRAALERATAAVAAQTANLANLEATGRLQEAMIEQATAEVAAADAEVARAQFDVVRYRQLASDQFASAQRFQQADADCKKATAAADKARAALAAARRQLAVIDAQKQQAQAGLAQANAERDLAELNLNYTELRAPIDGRQLPPENATGNFTKIVQRVPVRILLYGDGSTLGRLRPGLSVTATVDERRSSGVSTP
jgi:membrane fusion protein, multidrug efflux system